MEHGAHAGNVDKASIFIFCDKLNTLSRLRQPGVSKQGTSSLSTRWEKELRKKMKAQDAKYQGFALFKSARRQNATIGTILAFWGGGKRIGSESQTSYEYEDPPDLPIPHKGHGD